MHTHLPNPECYRQPRRARRTGSFSGVGQSPKGLFNLWYSNKNVIFQSFSFQL